MAASLIYVVDPDPLATRGLAQLLEQESDLDVVEFTQVAQLVDSVGTRPPDAVIAEATLRDDDGIRLCEALVKDDAELVTIVVTSASDPDGAAAALSRVGPLGHVVKPFDARDLLPKLRAGLERRALARALAGARAELAHHEQALQATRDQVEQTTAALEVTSSELATATERLVESEQLAAVGRVLTGIAHEITRQLALVGYAEAIRTRVDGDAELVELCDVIVNAHKRLCATVDQIRDFVTEPRRRTGLAREPADVVAVVDEALAILRYDRDVRTRKLVRTYRARPLAALHREKFQQVVINLVSNAALATRPGDMIEVAIDADPAAGDLTLTVSDRGVGMAPAVLAQIGQPFFTTRGETGSGLGVGICKRIVEEHGGTLTFRSELAIGTEASVRLPMLTAEAV